ncbi:MAG: hypothetical protein COS68_00240 [Elusimicrobia bacterium CG06_land_8_20_14_3_00_38_11]|nr:MAG: hypothetical protein COS68_00240 [Elusimicrobia bacterium CG06_land_8_20_14_3_00_38_11]
MKFVVIGAEAFPAYGYSRTTLDIDIFIEPTIENAQKTIKALKEFGYDVIDDITLESFLDNKTLIRQYLIATDIHPFVKGVEFQNVWKKKIRAKIGNIYVYFPSIEDMIKMKKAAGRVKDKEDLKYLQRILDLKKKKNK